MSRTLKLWNVNSPAILQKSIVIMECRTQNQCSKFVNRNLILLVPLHRDELDCSNVVVWTTQYSNTGRLMSSPLVFFPIKYT